VLALAAFLQNRFQVRKQHKQYAGISGTGKLLMGRIVDTRLEVDAGKRSAYTWFFSYSFQTPEGKLITGERRVTRKQWHQAVRGTSIAVLYASEDAYEIL
jgi:hypothetical protein